MILVHVLHKSEGRKARNRSQRPCSLIAPFNLKYQGGRGIVSVKFLRTLGRKDLIEETQVLRILLLGTLRGIRFLVLLFDGFLNCGIEIVEATQKVMMGI